MSFVLVTNDDGIDSPALMPLVRAVAALAPVRTVVPDRERSWVSKAITRHGEVRVERRTVDGFDLHAASGYPADCTQLGVHGLFPDRPRLVVSGINVGYNHGLAFLLGSGTVGAAAEGWIAGLPALAFSVGTTADWEHFKAYAWSGDSQPMWENAAAVAAEVVAVVLADGLPPGVDLISVNMPAEVTPATPRRITELARVGYDRLFRRSGGDSFVHDFGGSFRHESGLEGTDVEAARAGEVSITAIRLPRAAQLPPALGSRLVGGGDELVIRRVAPEEHATLGDLVVAAYGSIDPAYRPSPGYAEVLRDVAAWVEHGEVLVAIRRGRLAGGVAYVPGPGTPLSEFPDLDAAGIRFLAVAPSEQGRGVGRALAAACVERARAAGKKRVVLHSTEYMTVAHRLYESMGFRRTPARDWEPRPELRLIGYELEL